MAKQKTGAKLVGMRVKTRAGIDAMVNPTRHMLSKFTREQLEERLFVAWLDDQRASELAKRERALIDAAKRCKRGNASGIELIALIDALEAFEAAQESKGAPT